MDEFLSLAEVGCGDRAAEGPVAFRGETVFRRADFLARVGAWRDTLAGRGGTRWAIFVQDGYEFACALFGAWAAGKTILLPSDAQPGTVERLRGQVAGFIGEFPVKGALTGPEEGAPPSAPVRPDPDAEVLVVFTSGSTGEPAAIPKLLRQLDREIRTLHGVWGAEAGAVPVLASVSHQHIYGLLFKILWPLCRSAPFVSEQLGSPEEVVGRLTRAPGVWIASPALLKRLPSDLPWAATRPNLRLAICSGGPLPAEAASHCAELLGRPVIEAYGSSETGGVAWRVRIGAAVPWRPLPGVEVRACPERGLLAVRSPWLPTDDEWLTADRGEVAADGSFQLFGRADRIVKVEEKRISLTALERTLEGSELVREARALLLPEGRLAVIAILRPVGEALRRQAGRRAVAEKLRDWLRPHVEGVAIPRRFRFVETFPCDPAGKATDANLRALLAEPGAGPDEPHILQVERRELEVALRLHIPPDLVFFDGHFPQAPILPGVAQVEWAVRYAGRFFELPGEFQRLEQLKFQQVVTPETTLTLTLEWLPATSAVVFRYVSDAGRHSSGRIIFGGAGC
jgi:acyl-CoA synthetase (AMP-forming)/AMP-acid ligase II/3-hydroxymyristoyl/3-hydroxydecanoyl-(acyl carrier protein) dehydratase